jgi:ketosteroid isomerase-like protein
MDDEARRAQIRQFVAALNTRDLEWFDALYHDDVVIHWPQSGEVIRETSYYAAPFEAPAWRAKWVEPAASAAST